MRTRVQAVTGAAEGSRHLVRQHLVRGTKCAQCAIRIIDGDIAVMGMGRPTEATAGGGCRKRDGSEREVEGRRARVRTFHVL